MKVPRDLSGAEAVQAFKRLGFTSVRQIGSHLRLERNGRAVTVPMHKALAIGTLKSILRQSGITLDDFLAAL